MILSFPDILGFLATVGSLGGYWLNLRGRLGVSYLVWFQANVIWVAYSLIQGAAWTAGLFGVYAIMSLYGVLKSPPGPK